MILFLLVLGSGVLAGAEMAVVTARRGRLEQLAAAGSARAGAALALRRDPERFLASVQVGITLIGAIAGAFGGAAFALQLEPFCRWLGFDDAAPEVAFWLVVAIVTYLSVVFGELVPKSLALRVADRYAVTVARPMVVLGWIARPVVWLLTTSSNLVLRLFGDSTNFVEAKLTREDLEHLVEEASESGGIDTGTGDLMSRALEFVRLEVKDVMVPRRFVRAVRQDADGAALRAAMIDHGHRRVPVYEESIDRIVGYVLREDVLRCLWDGTEPRVAALLRECFFVPEVMRAERVLRELQARRLHLAIVVDEHGDTAGIVTLEDLVEELVGEIFHEHDRASNRPAQRQPDGSWLLQGTITLRDVLRETGVELPEPDDGRSVGGLLLELAGDRVPAAGEAFDVDGGWQLGVIEASPRRVRTACLRRVR